MRLLLLTVVALLSHAAPAQAGRDEEIALSGVLQRAHDHLDDRWLRRMMAPGEGHRFDEEGGVLQFRRHRQALGVVQLVSCAEGIAEPGVRLPSAAGDALPPQVYRCELACQNGAYSALLTLSPADPLVRPAPRPGRIERLVLASPLLDRTPWPWFARDGAAPWLGALFLAALLCLCFGTLRLSGRVHRARSPATDAAPRAPHLARAGHEVALVLRLLGTLLLLVVGGPLLLRLGPAPLWGGAATILGLVLLVALGVGLILCALGGYFRPWGGAWLAGALLGALVTLAVPSALWLRTSLGDLPALLGESAPPRQQGRYRLPLAAADGPAYVRHGGPLLDLVLLHPGGFSCKGRAPASCRAFGAAVLAPADGVVVEVADRYPDLPLGERDREHPMGNYVLIAQGGSGASSERVLLTHLQRGSVAVRPGQALRAGEALGRVGSSGDSDEPHLSMELVAASRPLPGRRPPPFCGAAFDPERSTGVPIYLDGYVRVGLLGRRPVPRGMPACGDRIAAAN